MKLTIILSLFSSTALCVRTIRMGGVDIVAHSKDSIIQDEYLIVFKKDANASSLDHFHTTSHNLQNKIQGQFRKFGHLDHFAVGDMRISYGRYSSDVLGMMVNHPSVEYVEANAIVRAASSQNSVSYNLDRLDRQQLSHTPTDDQDFSYAYQYATNGGAGVNVYILDSGIDTTHPAFGGRASYLWSNDGKKTFNGWHGTFVAGLVGGVGYGTAPKANLFSLKVLDTVDVNGEATGDTRNIGKALSVVMADAKARGGTPVVNLSLAAATSGDQGSMRDAVAEAVKAGVVVVAAAGNQNDDAANYSPACAKGVIVVGSTDSSDARWVGSTNYGSNYGSIVSVFAPSLNALGPAPGNGAGLSDGGTSFAAPQVAGIAALIIAQAGGTASPADVKNTIITRGNTVSIKNAGNGSPMKMAFNGGEAGLSLIKDSTTTTTVSSSSATTTKATSTTFTTSSKTTTATSTTTKSSSTTSSSNTTIKQTTTMVTMTRTTSTTSVTKTTSKAK